MIHPANDALNVDAIDQSYQLMTYSILGIQQFPYPFRRWLISLTSPHGPNCVRRKVSVFAHPTAFSDLIV